MIELLHFGTSRRRHVNRVRDKHALPSIVNIGPNGGCLRYGTQQIGGRGSLKDANRVGGPLALKLRARTSELGKFE